MPGVAPPVRRETAPACPKPPAPAKAGVTPDLIRGPSRTVDARRSRLKRDGTARARRESRSWTPDQVRGDDVCMSLSCFNMIGCRSDVLTRLKAGPRAAGVTAPAEEDAGLLRAKAQNPFIFPFWLAFTPFVPHIPPNPYHTASERSDDLNATRGARQRPTGTPHTSRRAEPAAAQRETCVRRAAGRKDTRSKISGQMTPEIENT